VLALAATSALVIACGGGGGGGGSASPAAYVCGVPAEGSYTISGRVTVAPGSTVDSDTLAFNSPHIDNGSFDSAQAIPRPVSVGGYASRRLSGTSGFRDTNDFYSVDLSRGDVVTLLVGDAFAGVNDLDLYIYDVNRKLIGASIKSGTLEALEVPNDGLYYLEVRVFEGSSTYVLSIAGGLSGGVTPTNFLAQEFVPGEMVVRYREPGTAKGLSATASAVSGPSLQRLAGEPNRAMRMRIPEYSTAIATAAEPVTNVFVDAQQRRKYETLMAVKELQHDAQVEFASLNYIRRTLAEPNDPQFVDQWHYRQINLPTAWDTTQGDPNVIVAVIDSGVRTDHPDLAAQLVDGYDFVSSPVRAGDGDGIDDGPFGAGFGSFHGTHVSGTAAAATNNGTGVAGAGWGVSLMPLRALGDADGTFYDIIQAMLYAAGLPNDSNTVPGQRADVINLSLGGPLVVPDGFEQSIVNQVREAGSIVVAAAGNQGNSVPFYPASYIGVISVSAVGRSSGGADPALASYSSFGPDVDIAAPGGEGADMILSTTGPDCDDPDLCPVANYSRERGTSMAAPHVAGVVALMQSARLGAGRPRLTPLEFDVLLERGALTVDLGSTGRDDQFGYGLIKANKAVTAAINANIETPPPELAVVPANVNFRSDLTAASVILSNSGGGELSVQSVEAISPDSEWLHIDAPVTENGLGAYVFRVDRSNLEPGDYEATVRAVSDANTLFIRVVMTVDINQTVADVGYLYVRLYEAEDIFWTGRQIRVKSTNGRFEFSEIPGGCYVIAAGTNLDNDAFIGDLGEAWSGYPNKVDLEPLLLDSNTGGIDFEIAFDQVELVPSALQEAEADTDPVTPEPLL